MFRTNLWKNQNFFIPYIFFRKWCLYFWDNVEKTWSSQKRYRWPYGTARELCMLDK